VGERGKKEGVVNERGETMSAEGMRYLVEIGKGRGLVQVAAPRAGEALYAVVEKGQEVVPIPGLDVPRRASAAVTMTSVVSFCAYVKEHRTDSTAIFAQVTREPYRFRAVMDFHGKTVPGWCEHVCDLVLTVNPEWTAWTGASGKMMGQEAFAEFIEQRAMEVATPDPARMMELALSLEGSQGCAFKGKRSLTSSDVSLVVDRKTEFRDGASGDAIEVPTELGLTLAVFRGTERRAIRARLVTRVSPPNLALGIVLIRPEEVVEQQLGAVHDVVVEETGVHVFRGWFGRE
jgi:uncharacterized protein YfdQ (DUF2303 family)